jgi:hypothetical protein
MRLIIALFAGVMLSQPLFAAPKKKPAPVKRAKSAFEAKFLTFNQLAALPQAKREQYVRDVIKLIVTMERANSHYEVADNGMSLEELKYKFATMQQWLQFLPEVEAREYQRTKQTASGVMTWDGNAFVCGQGYEVDLSIPGCLKVNTDGSTMFNEFAREHGSCDGMQEIAHPDPFAPAGAKACMTVQGFNKLGKLRREALRDGKDVFLDPNAFMRQQHDQQMEIAYGADSDSSSSQGNSALAGTPQSTAPGSASTPSPTQPAAPSAPDTATPAPGTPPAEAAPAAPQVATPAAPADEKPAVTPPEKEKPEVAEEDPKADKCIPEPTTCEDADAKKRDEAIARFRKTAKFEGLDANICIAGGFPSKYGSSKKQAGTCQPVYNWGPAHCKQNEILCNPVLFCHTLDNAKGEPKPQWFCAKKGTDGQWTAACAAELQKRMAPDHEFEVTYKAKDPKTNKSVEKVKKFKAQAKSCNPSDLKLGGFQEEWNKIVAGLEKLVDVWCGKNEGFKVLFCRECQIIKNQMYAMTKKATGSGCAPAAAAPGKTPAETEGDTGAPQESSTTK